MASNIKDITAVIQVIGNVYNNPQLLDLTDKYIITDEDFADNFHRIVFGAIYKTHELGAKNINLATISDFLSSRPKSEAVFKANRGEEWLLQVSETANPNSFDYYYSRLKKFSLLRAYENCGIDISDIYDINNILDPKKQQLQEEKLDNYSLENIAEIVDSKIESIKMQYVDGTYQEAQQAGEGIFDLIHKFEDSPEVGYPLYGPLINTVTRGARLKKFYLRSAATGIGKALPNESLVPTPIGWRKVGEIKPGDYLFGDDGKPTKVLRIHPQPEAKKVFKVVFADGRTVDCCGEHLWEVWYPTTSGQYKSKVIDTSVIASQMEKGVKLFIRLTKPVEYKEQEFEISPYILGLLLNDENIWVDKVTRKCVYSSVDESLVLAVAKFTKEETYRKNKHGYSVSFSLDNNPWIELLLKQYPNIWSNNKEDKFIPDKYLLGSVKQRLLLLQACMDSKGDFDSINNFIVYSSESKYMLKAVRELCNSLGMITRTYTKTGKNSVIYKLRIICTPEFEKQIFRLPVKKSLVERYQHSIDYNSSYSEYLPIVQILPTGRKANMTCFTVDNYHHLFLANEYIVTHNTRSMIADACYISCGKIYDENFGWIGTGVCEPTLFVTTEQETEEIQTMMLAFLSNVNEEHILNAEYADGEKERVLKAGEILSQAPLYIEELPNFSLQDVENLIKKNIREHEVRIVFYDYIHSSIKILEEITRRSGGIKLREDNILFMLSTRLKDICNQYGVFIMSATQLSGDYRHDEAPDQNLLRGTNCALIYLILFINRG